MSASNQPGIGVLGIGVFLPPEIRRNDFWSSATVTRWAEKASVFRARAGNEPPLPQPGAQLVAAAMAAQAGDPFQGGKQRHIMPEGMMSSDMEAAAARDALVRANVSADEIDLLLTFSMCPDYLNAPNACVVHRKLGLTHRCFSLAIEGVCNAFQLQFAVAEKMIRGGQARRALLIQSSAVSRFAPPDEQVSTVFGDGATAVVIGEVGPGRGLLAQAHRPDSDFSCSVVTGVRDGNWWDGGKPVTFSPDGAMARRMLMLTADFGKEVIDDALAQAGLRHDEVDFFACHQGTRWLRYVTQRLAGLTHARAVDTFEWAGSISAANIPLVLATAEREGLLRDGDVVTTFAGGTGITYASLVLRWGR